MFETFTERAREVLVLADDEARVLRHGSIGTEHLLLGLLREERGVAARVLGSLEITVEEVRAQVAPLVGQGEDAKPGPLPLSPHANNVLEFADREALSLGHHYIDTEHVLLALARDSDALSARILLGLGVDAETVRGEVMRVLTSEPAAPEPDDVRRARAAKEAAIEAQDFETAAAWRDRERALLAEARGISIARSVQPGEWARSPRRVATYSDVELQDCAFPFTAFCSVPSHLRPACSWAG